MYKKLVILVILFSLYSNAYSTENPIIKLGNNLYVGGDGPNNYTHIQDAINNASDGDTIFVYSGIYHENIIIDKSINLIGEDRNTTVIEGNDHDVVFITANKVNISGFTIRQCKKDNKRETVRILLVKVSNIRICKNSIINNDMGIYGEEIKDVEITDNIASFNGIDGINIFQSKNVIIENNVVINNSGGIYVFYSNNILIKGNVVEDSFETNIILDNTNNSIVEGNIVNKSNGGIRLIHSNNNKILNNMASQNFLDGIVIHRESNENIVIGNTLIKNCYGIRIDKSKENTIYHNNLIENIKNGYDTGDNTWYNETIMEGNYWDDFDSPEEGAYDNDSDGIVDSPYSVPGGNNKDMYPLIEPYYADSFPPFIEILSPDNFLYIMDRKIMPTKLPIIIGGITIVVKAWDNETYIEKIEFYVDDKLMHIDEKEPYEWKWNEKAFYIHEIKVIAYDAEGNKADKKKNVFIINC